jgi:anti-repressor protein
MIADTSIRQDADGRFCLNDLHRAAGSEKRHGASYWLANQQTRDLVAELETTGIPVVTLEGRNGGTFVMKELVYAYAMWISPAFHLKVIRAYDGMVTKPQFALPQSLPEALRLAADLAEKNEALTLKVVEQAPKVQFHDDVASAINCQTFDEVAKELGTGRIRLCRWLREQGYLMANNDPYQRYINHGLFRMVPKVRKDQRTGENISYNKTLITGKGMTHIHKRINGIADNLEIPANDHFAEASA